MVEREREERKDPKWVTGVKENGGEEDWGAKMEKHQSNRGKGINIFSLEIKYAYRKVHKL